MTDLMGVLSDEPTYFSQLKVSGRRVREKVQR